MRAWPTLVVAVLAPSLALAGGAEVASPPKPASVIVDFMPATGAPRWLASAFEDTITREVSGFERLAMVAKDTVRVKCEERDVSCRLRAYGAAAIDIVMLGQVSDGEIAYELYETWTPARIAIGSIALGRGQSAIGIAQATRGVLHPVLKTGGLLDQRSHAFHRVTPESGGGSSWTIGEYAIVLAVILAFALPFGVLSLLVYAGAWARTVALRSARRAVVVAAAMAIALAVLDPGRLAALVRSWPWVVAGIGGVLWGAFLLTAVRAIFPPLDGLPRIAHHDLRRVLRAWCLLCGERLVWLAVLYTPFGWATAWLASAFAIDDRWAVVLLAPVIGLAVRLWFASWIECAAVLHDQRLVDGLASARNPWSREIADYLMGYVRRTGWDLAPALLETVLLLPGKPGTGIATYGGGATHARIVIDKHLLELVMGPLVEVKPDEKPALWPDWTAAVVTARPGQPGRRVPGAVGDFRGRKGKTAYPGVQRKPLGQAATLLGYVLPEPGQIAPLVSDNPKDLAVVRALLSEHYPWFAPDPDDEFDATDPNDKDLLFGVLVRELGVVRRGESQLATLKLLLGARVARFTSRDRSRIADAYAAMNFARHHLIQYLHYLRTDDTTLLTARARSDLLHHTSTQVFRQLESAPEVGHAALRRRLAWLSQFFAQPIVDPRRARRRRWTALAAIGALLVAAGLAIQRAVAYHPVYAKRIEAQERDLAQSKPDADRDREKGNHGEAPEK